MNIVLDVRNLTKTYKNFILNDVSFTLEKGSVTGFIGINGSGKTTTVKSILGLCVKDKGNIIFQDKDVTNNEVYFKSNIGVVLDDGYFYKNLTIGQMKSIVAPSYKNWCNKDFNNYLERFNLNPKQEISTLSKGMRMKFALSLALSHKADLLIMDEPTSGLDPYIRDELMNILIDYVKNKDKTVFFSTHITSDLDKIADNVIMIDNGSLVFNENKDYLLKRHRIVECSNIKLLNDKLSSLFLKVVKTNTGFRGITNEPDKLQSILKEADYIKPTIEEVMLSYIREV